MFKSLKNITMFMFFFCFGISINAQSIKDFKNVQIAPLLISKILNKEMPKYIVGIFEDTSEIENAKINLSSYISSLLTSSGRVIVVERGDKLNQAFNKEQELNQTGLIVQNSKEIGQLLGADLILVTRVVSHSVQKEDKFSFDLVTVMVSVEISALDIKSGKSFFVLNCSGNDSSKIFTTSEGTQISGAVNYNNMYLKASRKAVESVSNELINKFPIMGFVLSITGNEILTDVGSDNQIGGKDIVGIVKIGDKIIHPITKEIIGYEKNIIAAGKILEIQNSTSKIAITDQNKDFDIKPGDVVLVMK